MKPALLLTLLGLFACTSAESSPGSGMDASVDSGADSGMDSGVAERRIFVTDTLQNANFGGLTGADALCASQAAAAGLEGEFKAWLSTIATSVSDRLTQSSVPYALVDGTRIADDWNDLVDSSLLAPVNLDASGLLRGGDVWTGTLPDGVPYANDDCAGFTSGSEGIALCGSTASAAGNWTANDTPACSTELRLYCIEQ